MKSNFLLFIATSAFCLFAETISAQSPNWQWAKGAGGQSNDITNSIAVDASGNVYVVGGFRSDNMVIGSTTLTNINSQNLDMFIAKYDGIGNALWAKSARGWSLDDAHSVTCDASGNIYVAGQFDSDSITFGSFTLFNKGITNVFLVKYDTNGNVIWAKSTGGSSDDYGMSVCTDALGNIYVAGFFYSDTVLFATDTLINTEGSSDIFILKYDPNGNPQWAKSAAGNSYDYSYSIATDVSGNIYLAGGFFSDSVSFGSLVLTNRSQGNYAAFIAKFNSNGIALWAKAANGNSDDNGNSVAADIAGNIYLAGQFESPFIVFGSDTLTGQLNSDYSMFIVKYDSLGNELWAKGAKEEGTASSSYSVAVDFQGNAYVAGYFAADSIINFGSSTLYATDGSLFVVKYDGNGNVIWAKNANGKPEESATSVAIDPSGSVYIAGLFSSDTLVFSSSTLINHGGGCGFWPMEPCNDIFLAKLSITLGIDELPNTSGIQIYPNPASNKITLKFNALYSKSIEIKIFDMIGKTVFSDAYNLVGEGIEIVIANLNVGIYLVNIQSEEFSRTKKLIVTK